MTSNAPTTRFTDRVTDYVRYRPHYPTAVVETLQRDYGWVPGATVADIGSGTGISTELLLRAGHRVFAIEPNAAMRAAAEAALAAKYPNFVSVTGTAEATTLPTASVDCVVAAQAFHWFDVAACRTEWRRVLRDPPRVALLWNNRREDTPFLAAYEMLLQEFALDYGRVKHQNVEADGRLTAFLAPGWTLRTFENVQRLDFDGLAGRLRSSSYMPNAEHPRFGELMRALRELFDVHARAGVVELVYATQLYVGTVTPAPPQ